MSQFKPQEDLVTLTKQKLKPPVQFKVLLHNDDYTTMDFVVRVLEAVFHKTADEAIQIMLQVHKTGVGICGVYCMRSQRPKLKLFTRWLVKTSFLSKQVWKKFDLTGIPYVHERFGNVLDGCTK